MWVGANPLQDKLKMSISHTSKRCSNGYELQCSLQVSQDNLLKSQAEMKQQYDKHSTIRQLQEGVTTV